MYYNRAYYIHIQMHIIIYSFKFFFSTLQYYDIQGSGDCINNQFIKTGKVLSIKKIQLCYNSRSRADFSKNNFLLFYSTLYHHLCQYLHRNKIVILLMYKKYRITLIFFQFYLQYNSRNLSYVFPIQQQRCQLYAR